MKIWPSNNFKPRNFNNLTIQIVSNLEISPLAGPFLAADRVHGGSGVLDVLVTLDRDVGSPTTTKPVW